MSTIGDLIRFGPEYLSKEEMNIRLMCLVDNYYNFLALSVLKYLRNKDFWKRQKLGLQEIGMEFSIANLCKAIIIKGLNFLLEPKQVIKKILVIKNARKNASKIEANYF